MKKSILLVLAVIFLLLSFSASVNADIMSWTDRQKLDDKLESKPIGDEDGWADLQSEDNPGTDDNDQDLVTDMLTPSTLSVINILWLWVNDEFYTFNMTKQR